MVPEQFNELFKKFSYTNSKGITQEVELFVVPDADPDENGFVKMKNFNEEYLKSLGFDKDHENIYFYAKQIFWFCAKLTKGKKFKDIEKFFDKQKAQELNVLYEQYLKHLETMIKNS